MYDPRDPYLILEISRSADLSTIRSAYRALACRCHPDVNKDAVNIARMQDVNWAYSVLSEPGVPRRSLPPQVRGLDPMPDIAPSQSGTPDRPPHAAQKVPPSRMYLSSGLSFLRSGPSRSFAVGCRMDISTWKRTAMACFVSLLRLS